MTDKNLSQGTDLDAAARRQREKDQKPSTVVPSGKAEADREPAKLPVSFISCVRVDLQYAMKQLREFKDHARALDALMRIENHLAEQEKGNFPP